MLLSFLLSSRLTYLRQRSLAKQTRKSGACAARSVLVSVSWINHTWGCTTSSYQKSACLMLRRVMRHAVPEGPSFRARARCALCSSVPNRRAELQPCCLGGALFCDEPATWVGWLVLDSPEKCHSLGGWHQSGKSHWPKIDTLVMLISIHECVTNMGLLTMLPWKDCHGAINIWL